MCTHTARNVGRMTQPSTDLGPQRRVLVPVRLLPKGRDDLQERAHRLSLPGRILSLSDTVRASLAVAASHPEELDKMLIKIRDGA